MSNRHGQTILKTAGFAFYRYIWNFVDCDYLDSLSPEDQKWMLQFLREHYQCETEKFGENALFTREQSLDAKKCNTRAWNDILSYKDKSVTYVGDQETWETLGIAEMSHRSSGALRQRGETVEVSPDHSLDEFFNEK